ncbi:hypothetical protein [Paenibacillus turpanensis]|uniref:hypothetical protein n=1 Tax=Paenibacillus turpanensis TaxID=2689078 RepID=UPI0014099424|nr:hypothetical protein [Paenibacillus turpanensis]
MSKQPSEDHDPLPSRKWWDKSVKNERGSVSVLLLLLFAAFFLFCGLLVDIARIYMADNRVETALRAGARSALSGYDTGVKEYGLFGVSVGDEQIKQWSIEVVQAHLRGQGKSGWTAAAVESSKLHTTALYPLADHTIFRQQVMERMKYVAPAEFAVSITEGFRKTRAEAAAVQTYTEQMKQLEQLQEKREQALRAAKSKAEELIRDANRFHNNFTSYIAQATHPEMPSYSAGDAALSQYSGMTKTLNELFAHLQEANQVDREMAGYADQTEQSWRSQTANASAEWHGLGLLGEDYFAKYRSDAAELVAYVGKLCNQWSARKGGQELRQANGDIKQGAQRWGQQLMQKEAERQAAYDRQKQAEKGKKQEAETEGKKALSQALKGACERVDLPYYIKLLGNGGALKYLQYNENQAAAGSDYQAPEPVGSSGLGAIQFLSTVSSAAELLRNDMYLNEFALTTFNHRLRADEYNHVLEKQEAEYILYGLPGCEANISAAYAEMFAVRTALRTAEALLQPARAAAGTPALAFFTALAEGVRQASLDMEKLINGESVELFAKTPSIRLNYGDYLRIFYLLHSSDDKAMARMQALIELQTGTDLTKAYTSVHASVEARVPYWFMPRVLRGSEGGKGSYAIYKQVSDSY